MPPRPDDVEGCELELKGGEAERYEELRRRRRQERLDRIEADLDAWQEKGRRVEAGNPPNGLQEVTEETEGGGEDELGLLPPFGEVPEALEAPDPSPEPDCELWDD